jgi:hypothetical protein
LLKEEFGIGGLFCELEVQGSRSWGPTANFGTNLIQISAVAPAINAISKYCTCEIQEFNWSIGPFKSRLSMIRRSVKRFSEQIMLNQRPKAR